MPRADKASFIQNMLSELQLKQNGSAPAKPEPDSKEWWREVAQGLGVEVNRERAGREQAKAEVARLREALEGARRHIAMDEAMHDYNPFHEDGEELDEHDPDACAACMRDAALIAIDAALSAGEGQ